MARKIRQRTPLQQLSDPTTAPANVASTAKTTATSTVNTNVRAPSTRSIATSNIPSIPSSATPSISSIASIKTNSTITPSVSSSVSKDQLTKPKGGGFFSSRSTANSGSSKNVRPSANRQESGQENSGTARIPGGHDSSTSSSDQTSGLILLPLLPALDDFELSMPFLSEPAFSSTSSAPPSFTPISSTYSTTRPLNSAPTPSTLTPSNRQFLASQSSKGQDSVDPSTSGTVRTRALPSVSHNEVNSNSSSARSAGHLDRKPSMQSKTSTTDASGTIRQQSPLDLSRLEVSDYFMSNGNEPRARRPSAKSSGYSRTEDGSSVAERSEKEREPMAEAPTTNSLLNPPKYVIQRPTTSRAESPSPSKASSVLSDKSSRQSSQQQQYKRTLDTPVQQHPTAQASQHETTVGSAAATPSATAITNRASRGGSSPRRGLSPVTDTVRAAKPASPPAKSPPMTAAPKKEGGLRPPAGTVEDRDSPNLRSRLSRLFRPNAKQDRPAAGMDQRQSDQQRQLRQGSGTVSNASTSSSTRQKPQSPSQAQVQAQAQAHAQPLGQGQGQGQVQPKQLQPQNQAGQKQQQQSGLHAPAPTPGPRRESLPAPAQATTPAMSILATIPSSPTAAAVAYFSTLDDPPATARVHSRNTSTAAFAPGIAYTPPGSPIALTREETRARQRRVSSVSSTHSIRQVGTYGNGNVNPNKMISPARKANPYYSGVIARFGNGGSGGKHTLHNRDTSSSSGRRRSMVSVGGERAKVGAEAISGREKLTAAEQTKSILADARRPSVTSTAGSLVSDANKPIRVSVDYTPTSASVSPSSAPTFTATYNEEYQTERDESAKTSVQSSPFGTVRGNSAVDSSLSTSALHHFTASPASPTTLRTMYQPPTKAHQQYSQDPTHFERPSLRTVGQSNTTTWSRVTTGDIGTIPDTESIAMRTDSALSRVLPSESQDSDAEATPSISTFSSSQLVRDYRKQGIIITEENWEEDEQQHDGRAPTVHVQRPSVEVSILPEQPPFAQSTRPMSTASSIMSSNSNKHPQLQQPQRFDTVGQWSESSYDPCAPLRWDELFEMDPSSKGPLWLSNRGLGQIPHEFFDGLRNLRELYMDHNDIKVVPDSLLKLTKLDVLDLSYNSISSFHAAFKLKKLKNLRRLNLDHNMLTDISPVYKLKALRELRMNTNFVPYLANAIQNMTKLKILAMESNSLATLPETMGKLGSLCELRLSDNNLRILPDSIGTIRTLQVLALRSNLLEKLPESLKDMENLSTLDLACNRLTSLPSDIVRLPKLTHLDLHDNQLQALPEKIGQLSNLIVLQLCNNQLRELPKDIGRLRDLQDLVLSFNQLQFLPDEIGKLSKLQELKFDNNPLKALPRTIQRLTNVRRVHLQGCELRDLPVELGIAFKDLIYLDLSGNQFEVMPALDQMAKLEEFYISNNFLREIGTSSLNLQSSSNASNGYNTIGASGYNGGGSGQANHTQSGSGSGSAGGQMSGGGGNQGGNQGNSHVGQGSGSGGFGSSMSGGLTASKLHELKRLRVFEAHDNQIRTLTTNVKTLQRLEVLDLGNNLLNWLPKEVGDLADLKVLILEGNPIKSLPSTLTKLMGTLEVFRVGKWPENGFEITRDQAQMNMKISVLQSYMPQQIERTLLLRMHESILRRVQELDSQQYRDQHEQDRAGSGSMSKGLVPSSSRFSADSGIVHLNITHGLAIANQNMMFNRSFALPSASSGDHLSSSLLTVNSEGINPNYVESTSTLRNLSTLQLANLRSQSASITALPFASSPQSASLPSGPMSSFPLLNSLRPRKSQQQMGTKGSGGSGSRPKTMYASNGAIDPQQQDQQVVSPSLSNRMSRVFDFTSINRQRSDGGTSRVATLESSTLHLSSDAMLALGLGTQPGSAGSVITHSNSTSRRGDGSLNVIRSSMAMKSSPSLTSVPAPLFSTLPSSSTAGGSGGGRSKTSIGRSLSSVQSHTPAPLKRSVSNVDVHAMENSERSATSLPWLRLKGSPAHSSPSQDGLYQQEQHLNYQPGPASTASTAASISPSSLLQPSINGQAIAGLAPPPILLDYDLRTSSLLDSLPHMYYSAGGDDVDGDHPDDMTDGNGTSRVGGETEDDYDDRSTTTGFSDGRSFSRRSSKGKARMAESETTSTRQSTETLRTHQHSSYQQNNYQYQQQQQQQQQQTYQQHVNATDPVLKIAVLKGIYDQILQNMDHLVEQNVQESPAKKNNRFKLLNTLRFLKADRSGNNAEAYQQQQQHHQYQHHHQHSSLSSTLALQ
ncbi:hypothetical protein BGZ99_005325 [Dissophora globulifera]|uniref:Disease resistance R13L4/SHOC-2-like LRR domain-containing protein n=1 Tax=Dissophora globulifera TaxID=979702 RepID=A0A9P6RJP9_9FUNG|nr:hypothetical protein BGZ99_005325 [Dissophora globulifera]